MDFDRAVTNFAGLGIVLIGLASLADSLLQIGVFGRPPGLFQGTMLSIFTVLMGGVLLTESATAALKQFRASF